MNKAPKPVLNLNTSLMCDLAIEVVGLTLYGFPSGSWSSLPGIATPPHPTRLYSEVGVQGLGPGFRGPGANTPGAPRRRAAPGEEAPGSNSTKARKDATSKGGWFRD